MSGIDTVIQCLSDQLVTLLNDCLSNESNDLDICIDRAYGSSEDYIRAILAICETKKISIENGLDVNKLFQEALNKIRDRFFSIRYEDREQGLPEKGNFIRIDYNNEVFYLVNPGTRVKSFQISANGKVNIVDGITNSNDYICDLSPVCCDYIDGTQIEFVAMFNGSKNSRRVFNEVHYYKATENNSGDPHITIGFGHFAEGTLIDYFEEKGESYFKDGEKGIRNLTDKMVSFMVFLLTDFVNQKIEIISGLDSKIKNNQELYKGQINRDLGISSYDPETLKKGLMQFFLKTGDLTKWHKKRCSDGKNLNIKGGELNDDWFSDLLLYALLLHEVCKFQVEFWKKNLYDGIVPKAKDLGYDGNEIVPSLRAVLMSWKSTGWASLLGSKDAEGQIVDKYGKKYDSDKYILGKGGVIYKNDGTKVKKSVPTGNFNNEYFIRSKGTDIRFANKEDKSKVEALFKKAYGRRYKYLDGNVLYSNDTSYKDDNAFKDDLVTLLIWFGYNHFKGYMRSRQASIWNLFLKKKWNSNKEYPNTINDITEYIKD